MNNWIKANYLFPERYCLIKQSEVRRNWMDSTPNKFAYRCLPLSIANQCSYDVLSPGKVKATWNGDNSIDGISVEFEEDCGFNFASSLFGHGILTFHVDFVITSNEGNCLYVKGPANSHKKNIQALEGVVETFWLPFTFTMNWKFETPCTVEFDVNEPLFTFFPINLKFLESFEALTGNIWDDKSFEAKVNTYSDLRNEFVTSQKTPTEWQKFYMQGVTPFLDQKQPNHKTRVDLKEFKDNQDEK